MAELTKDMGILEVVQQYPQTARSEERRVGKECYS